jgi:hypothetical protein
MNGKSLTPTRLRLILVGSMIAMIAVAVAVFMLGYRQISAYSASSRAVAAEAQASNSSLQELIAVKKELEDDADVVQRASLIVSESKSYLYQDQIIQDINRYATSAGITVTNITFAGTGATTGSSTTSTAPSPTAGSTPPPAGVKTTTASVTVANPVDYNKMLTFIHSIENSLFKMRISQVTLSKSAEAKAPNDVTSDVLNIEVYIR